MPPAQPDPPACAQPAGETSPAEAAEAPASRGGAFYDDPAVFERYHRPRPLSRSPNHVMEEPAFLEALGDVRGQRIIDLGCGDAALGPTLLDAGARSYLGVDGSARMVEVASRTLSGTAGRAVRCDIEDFTAPADSADVVVSRLALHYVEDLTAILRRWRRCLSANGRIVVTVLHPVTTCHDPRGDTDRQRTNWVVDGYFSTGPRPQAWLGGSVTWHHRTIEDHVTALHAAGFTLTDLRECAPRADRFGGDTAEYDRRRRVPLFLLLAGSVRSSD